jgi:hypothetical protein
VTDILGGDACRNYTAAAATLPGVCMKSRRFKTLTYAARAIACLFPVGTSAVSPPISLARP